MLVVLGLAVVPSPAGAALPAKVIPVDAAQLPAFASSGARVPAPVRPSGDFSDRPPTAGQPRPVPRPPKTGFVAATSVPVAGQQSATSEVFRNSDGSHTLRLFDHPVQFVSAGKWLPIRTQLVPDPSAKGFVLPAGSNSWSVSFEPLPVGVSVVTGEGTISFAPVGVAGIDPVLDATGDGVTYFGVWPGVDVRYQVTSDSVVENILLSAPTVQTSFPFTVSGVGLGPDAHAVGALAASGSLAGVVQLAAPVALRADGAPATDAGATLAVSAAAAGAAAGSSTVTVGVDPAWLAHAAASAFPVDLDPTINVGAPSSETAYKGDSANSNLATTGGVLQIGNPDDPSCNDGDSCTWRSVATFNWGTQLSGQDVTAASLALTETSGTANSYPIEILAYGGCSGWECTGGGTLDDANLGATGTYSDTAMGAYFASLEAGQSGQLFLAGDEVAGLYTYKQVTAALTLTYDTPPPAVTQASAVPASGVIDTATPTLSVAPVTDPDGSPVTYWFRMATGPDAESGDIVVDSGWTSATSWSVPVGALSDGVDYYWHVWTFDGQIPTMAPWVDQAQVNLRLGAKGPSPYDTAGPASVNLSTGNLVVATSSPTMNSVGGPIGVSYTYNSQQQSTAGLRGSYFADPNQTRNPSGLVSYLVRTDPVIDFSWSPPTPDPSIPASNWVATWTGYITPPAGSWYLGTIADDGTRIILGGSTTVFNNWVTQAAPASAQYGTAYTFTGGPVPIEIDYFQNTGPAEMQLYAQPAGGVSTMVPGSWLSTVAPTLPNGWTASASLDGAMGYTRAVIATSSVAVYDATGTAHTYTENSLGGYTPPAGEDGVMSRDANGLLQLADDDGSTYTFNPDGTVATLTNGADSVHPASAQYGYSNVNGITMLTTITDPVSGRTVTLVYGGQAACAPASLPNPPSAFAAGLAVAPGGRLCAVQFWDGTTEALWYDAPQPGVNAQLRLIVDPGSEYTWMGYTNGRLAWIVDPLQADAIIAGQTTATSTPWARTDIAYDTSNRVASVTQAVPSPTATTPASRPQDSYVYTVASAWPSTDGETRVHVAGITESPSYQWERDVTFDPAGRLLVDTDADGVRTATQTWDSNDNLLTSTDSAGRETVNRYDSDNRPTGTWGPAPTDCFNTAVVPPASPVVSPQPGDCPASGVAHTSTVYDGGMIGLAASYWNNPTLSGAPERAATGLDGVAAGDLAYPTPDGEINQRWHTATPPASQSVPYPELTPGGWSARYTGEIVAPASEPVTFSLGLWGNARLWVDDTLVCDDWTNAAGFIGCGANASVSESWTPGSVHKIRVDFAPGSQGADIELRWNQTSSTWASGLTPDYSLTTQTTTADTTAGSPPQVITTGYANPENGLATTVSNDGLTTTTGYETPGTGFLRPVSVTLPGGLASPATQTTTGYYGNTQTVANPCNTTLSYDQAGLAETETDATPATGNPVSNTTVYDNAGRPVATYTNNDPPTCTSYDLRGRVSQVTYPAAVTGLTGGARTVTNCYGVADPAASGCVEGNPLVNTISDPTGTITTTLDLLGRQISYTDVWGDTTTTSYDQAGRVTDQTGPDTSGPTGDLHATYDAADRVTTQSLDGTTVATPAYNPTTGETSSVAYGNGTSLASIGRDGAARITSTTFDTGTTVLTADTVGYSMAGRKVSETEDGTSSTFGYDGAGRLTAATVGAHSYSYHFDNAINAATACPIGSEPAADAGADTDRTAMTDTVGGLTATTTYCYDQADRLLASTASGTGSNYTAVTPTRIADTRSGSGAPYAGQTLAANTTLTIQATLANGDQVPYSAVAVVLAVTALNATTATFVTVYPAGEPLPATSNLNLSSTSGAVDNQVTATIGVDGQISIYNAAGSTDVIVDVMGYYSASAPGGGGYNPLTTPSRICDTRTGTGITANQCDHNGVSPGTLTANTSLTVQVTGANGVPTGATAAIVDLTSVNANPGGYLTAYPAGTSQPDTSNLNYQAAPVTTETTVALGANGAVKITNSQGTTDVIVDLEGFYSPGAANQYTATAPSRIADTRAGSGKPLAGQTLTAGAAVTVPVTAADAGVPSAATAVVVNVTVADATTGGYLTVYPTETVRPNTSNVNFGTSQAVADEVTTGLGTGGAITIYNSAGNTDILVDVEGYFAPPATGGTTTTVGYDSHGNTTTIAGQTLTYDMADRNITIAGAGTTVTYKRDATDRIVEQDTTTNGTTTIIRYGYTGDGDSPDLILTATNTVTERDITLAGGVLYAKTTTGHDTWSYPDIHGDIAATANDTGTKTGGTYTYDPYGNPLNGQPGDTTATGNSYGWEGQHQRITDTATGTPIIQMGARLYLPSTGRFLQLDPIIGGSANNYDYVNGDPVNNSDLSGTFHYTFNYNIGASDLSATDFTMLVTLFFGELFPVHGHASRLTGDGQRMALSILGVPFPVVVSRDNSTGWRFNTGPFHPDYPGWIDFTFTRRSGHIYLRVHGYVPDYSLGGLIGKGIYKHEASNLWGHFAHNLRRFNANF